MFLTVMRPSLVLFLVLWLLLVTYCGKLRLRLSCVPVLFFFFSSRRRHTRFDCDWSSDVCSSDLIGLGRIGKAVAQRAHHGFGMRVIFHDPYPPPPAVVAELGAEPRGSVDDVLREADFVSLHSPATPETRHLIDARRLALMKRGAFLINNARGDIVDELALVTALKQGTIAGAGLDVFEREPAVTPDLLTMENVVLLPHLGSATHETRIAMGLRALDNLKAFFAGAPPRDRVA